MATVIRTPAALRDLAAITDWIANDNLDAALRFYDEVDRSAERELRPLFVPPVVPVPKTYYRETTQLFLGNEE